MMVPKSYVHAKATSSNCLTCDEKVPIHVVSSKARATEIARKGISGQSETAHLTSTSMASPSTSSKPVVIPARTTRDGPVKRGGYGRRESSQEIGHNASLVSPSASALLAMTTTPIFTRRKKQLSQRQFVPNIHGAMQQAMEDGSPRRSLSSSSPQTWDFLLSAPDTCDIQSDTSSSESDTTIAPSLSIRSLSMESIPSLEEDEESICSCSGPVTPSLVSRSRHTKKSLSTSRGQDAIYDHPLLSPPPASYIWDNCSATIKHKLQPTKAQTRSSFKSNLTASFHAIRSAARSISAFNPPAPPEDLLSNSILALSLPYSVERRPIPCDSPPEPALRRYLNPIFLSPAEFHSHRGSEQSAIKSSIQLQSYQRGVRHSRYASRPPIFVPNESGPLQAKEKERNRIPDRKAVLLTSSLSLRHREPRENSDFLRIVVLEMNMRKEGKLEGLGEGRAKLWLPARQEMARDAAQDVQKPMEESFKSLKADRKVPLRWTGLQA